MSCILFSAETELSLNYEKRLRLELQSANAQCERLAEAFKNYIKHMNLADACDVIAEYEERKGK